MELWAKIVKGAAAAAGLVAGLFGGWTPAMTVLAVFMGADYILGCICGLLGKSTKTEGGRWLSTTAFKGLLKKGVIMVVVLIASQLDKVVAGGAATFQTLTVFYYIANEGLSVIENAALLGAPFPDALKNALEMLKDKGNSGEGSKEE